MRLRDRLVVVIPAVLAWSVVGVGPAVALSCAGPLPILDAVQNVDRTITWQQPRKPVKKPDRLVKSEGISASVIVENWDHYPLTGTTEIRGISGIYEQKTVATSPAFLFVREEVSVSTVTRYWGEPPANLGLHAQHGELFQPILMLPFPGLRNEQTSECGVHSPLGAVGYRTTRPDEANLRGNGLSLIAGEGPGDSFNEFGVLTPTEEAALEARFGPPTVVNTPLASLRAYLWVWAAPVLFTAAVVLLVWALVKRRRKRLVRHDDREPLAHG